MTPEVDQVRKFAEMMNEYGANMIVAIVLGLFFMLMLSMMFRQLMKKSEEQDAQRIERENRSESERRQLMQQVLL